jgi:copper chaperone CopZ
MKKLMVLLVLFFIPTSVFADTYSLTVEGMVCDFCAQGIQKKLNKEFKDQNIKNISVDLNNKQVTFESQPVDQEKLKELIKAAGYNLKSIEVKKESAEKK